ncbi:MAG: non-hydrolyzing UDP-N-acetylglucosamine 2-epimerase [Candidatus Binatia bacterium]
MKILLVAGARPNFIKIAPLMREMGSYKEIKPLLVHTGQHYDVSMAGQFFRDLQIPTPNVSLDVGSGSHAYQTAEVMRRIEPVLIEERPNIVLVVGDVNSTLAAAVTAAKLHIPVAHVEAGLRSFDRTMPEEINRIVTDAVSDYLFVSEESGIQNLQNEGVAKDKVHFVGNVMIDSLETSRQAWARSLIRHRLGLEKRNYGVVTLHRPANVDNAAVLRGLLSALGAVAREMPIVFPVHPRTRKQLERVVGTANVVWQLDGQVPETGICCMEPLGYLDFMALVSQARLVLTDSGGLQEETSVLGVPCLTLRENTERPATVTHGTNRLVGLIPEKIIEVAQKILRNPPIILAPPPLWDGRTSGRIVRILKECL